MSEEHLKSPHMSLGLTHFSATMGAEVPLLEYIVSLHWEEVVDGTHCCTTVTLDHICARMI
jgi:hypothetical protein